jgi:hypothetical protein
MSTRSLAITLALAACTGGGTSAKGPAKLAADTAGCDGKPCASPRMCVLEALVIDTTITRHECLLRCGSGGACPEGMACVTSSSDGWTDSAPQCKPPATGGSG